MSINTARISDVIKVFDLVPHGITSHASTALEYSNIRRMALINEANVPFLLKDTWVGDAV